MMLVNRVSLFFLAALALCLVGYSALFYLLIRSHLYGEFDRQLQNSLHVLVAAVEVEVDGVKWQPSDHTIMLGDERDADEVRWVINDGRNRIVDQSRNLLNPSDSDRSLLQWTTARHGDVGDASVDGWRYLRRRLTATSPKAIAERDADEFSEVTITVARTTRVLRSELWQLAALVCLLPVTLWCLAAAVGRNYCRRAIRPVSAMALRARSMTQADFQLRLPVAERADELAELANAFNGLLDRLEQAFERQRRFTGDAAHQLRTPLTVLGGQIDVALRRPRAADEYRDVLVTLRDQTSELGQLVESLLFLARADEDASLQRMETIDLKAWLPEYLKRWQLHPRGADLAAVVREARVEAPPALLKQLLDNLIDNAMKYSEAGSPITVDASQAGSEVVISVHDQGMGVQAEDRPYIFDPFYRATEARQSGADGTGLGLALVARIAAILGGRVVMAPHRPRGSQFLLYLPAAAGAITEPAIRTGSGC